MDDKLANDPARSDELILVDGLDRQVGTATKERAHRAGLLHRAFSVVLTRPSERGIELLLASRASGKYHSAGLWANSCCSHPRAEEALFDAAHRRVREELGVEVGELTELTAFVYRAEFPDGVCEYEYDHVLLAEYTGDLSPDPAEVGATRWVSVDEVAHELADAPEHFAPWAFTVLSIVISKL